MKRLLPLLVLLGAAPVGSFRLETRLPESTVLFAEAPSAAKFRDAFRKTRLSALFQNEEIRPFGERGLSDLIKNFNDLTREFEKELGDKAWEQVDGQAAFAFVAIEPHKAPDIVVSVECPGKRDWLAKGVALLRRRCKTEVWKAGAIEVTSGAIDRDLAWHLAILDDTFLATTHKSRMEQIIAGEPKALARSETFLKAREKGGAGEAFFYADIAGFLKGAEPHLGERGKKQFAGLGLDGFRFASGSLSLGEKITTERFFLATAGDRKGLASLKGAATGLESAPADALTFLSVSIDLAEAHQTLLDLAQSFDVGDELSQFENSVDFSIAKDLLPAFGPRITAYSALPPDGLIPDTVSCFEIKDAARFDKCLKGALKKIPAELDEIVFKGKKIHYFKFLEPPMDELRPILATIFFMRDGDTLALVAGLGGANALKRHILRQEKGKLAGPGVKAPDASLILYLDFERLFNLAFNSTAPLAVAFKDLLPPANLMRLPLGETLGAYLGQATLTARVEAEGLRIEGSSASGMTLVTAVYAAGAAVVLTPALRAMNASQRTAACLSNCSYVFAALWRHQSEKGTYPTQTGAEFFKELADSGYLSQELICPHAEKAAYRGPARDINTMKDPDVLFCDEPGNHPDGSINILRKNGAIETITKDHSDYAKALKTTKGN